MSKYLTRILLILLLINQLSVLASPSMDDDVDEDIYSTLSTSLKSKKSRLDDEKFELFQKVHDILISLPSPIVDNLKLRKRVPVVIKMHEILLKAFAKVVPDHVLKIDKNMAMILLPVIILVLAQLVYMLIRIPQALVSSFVDIAPKKVTWYKKEFQEKFSFDQVDQLSQIKAVSSEIQNAKLLITQQSKGKGPGQGSNEGNEMESIKETLQQQLQTVNQLIQSVQREISEVENKRASQSALLQSLATKVDYIYRQQQTSAQQTQADFQGIKEHMMQRTIKLQNSQHNGNNISISEQYKAKSAQHIAKEEQQEYLETQMATADQGLNDKETEYYYSLPVNQDGEDVEYYYDEEDVDEEEDEVQL